jgi:hypothetical protein
MKSMPGLPLVLLFAAWLRAWWHEQSKCDYAILAANIATPSAESGMPDLILLDEEEVLERVTGVMNLSKDYGQLGVLWLTSIRICWAAQLQENYNCSLPYLQVLGLACNTNVAELLKGKCEVKLTAELLSSGS